MRVKQEEKFLEEPPVAVAEAMKSVDVVICITQNSLTHTKAKKEAAEKGARIATIPGITRDMSPVFMRIRAK
jgi:leucyl aminopeptidase (aminopeptidase T)